MARGVIAAALLVLLTSVAARADEYATLIKDCQHGDTDPDKAIKACPPLAEMQGAEPIERAYAYQNLAIAYQVKGDDGTAIAFFDKALKNFPDFLASPRRTCAERDHAGRSRRGGGRFRVARQDGHDAVGHGQAAFGRALLERQEARGRRWRDYDAGRSNAARHDRQVERRSRPCAHRALRDTRVEPGL